jgi:hypothetical protein
MKEGRIGDAPCRRSAPRGPTLPCRPLPGSAPPIPDDEKPAPASAFEETDAAPIQSFTVPVACHGAVLGPGGSWPEAGICCLSPGAQCEPGNDSGRAVEQQVKRKGSVLIHPRSSDQGKPSWTMDIRRGTLNGPVNLLSPSPQLPAAHLASGVCRNDVQFTFNTLPCSRDKSTANLALTLHPFGYASGSRYPAMTNVSETILKKVRKPPATPADASNADANRSI